MAFRPQFARPTPRARDIIDPFQGPYIRRRCTGRTHHDVALIYYLIHTFIYFSAYLGVPSLSERDSQLGACAVHDP